jgi:branched-chain amino acid transport system permease protein
MRGRAPVLAGLAVVAALITVFPIVVTDPTATSIGVFTLVFMVSAAAWNVFSGYSGYLALGHAVFFGTGGYAVALAAQDWHVAGGWPVFALLPFGGLVAGLIAIPVGLVALRTRRHTFVVVTIAIFFIFQLAATNLGFTGGTSGILLPIAPFSAANFNQPFYYIAFVILIATVLVSWAIRRSRFGLQLLAIRDDEDRALGLGVKTRRLKLIAFVISAVPIGMVGGLYFYFVGQIFPQFAFDPLFDLSILILPRGVVPGIAEWLERRRVRALPSGPAEREGAVSSGVAGAAR